MRKPQGQLPVRISERYPFGHFSHLMRAKTGWSFIELLTRLRVDRACHLLVHTDHSLARIAQDCSYSEQSYFTRVFRKRTGQTPGDFRNSRTDVQKCQTNAQESKLRAAVT